jgi:arsenite methyltransferase
VVRGLVVAGVLLAAASLAAPSRTARHGLSPGLFRTPAVALLATAGWMVWSSRAGKRRAIEALLDRYRWSGDELVLDIGCGRGLATIAAAQRLCSGHVVGIDLWRSADLSGNTQPAADANAEIMGVTSRVSFKTADATALPFPDASFDVVVSMTVLHTLSAPSRAHAVREALRVLVPGGTLLIFDILYARSYAKMAAAGGAQHVWLSAPTLLWGVPGWSMRAAKAPLPG